ncbi:MAG: hypothetical protein AVDCRST_MAG29-579 [uncultured Nocardioidaceae bacterium]|uniref:Uncharacterized protein n=1 Tax=uncultured Nocardioidaceae bacterium TaxID=253824 RepID=A0A6J4L7F0_9ACTN|nr:MAG: hypothetical protein AVDCRST_MAG29-579 [uncultured Nocardioidaceae bacterium]
MQLGLTCSGRDELARHERHPASNVAVPLPPRPMRHSDVYENCRLSAVPAMTSDAGSPARPDEIESGDEASQPVEHTGVPAVDAALSRLETLSELPLREHPAVYEQVHADLRDALDGPSTLPVPSTPRRS